MGKRMALVFIVTSSVLASLSGSGNQIQSGLEAILSTDPQGERLADNSRQNFIGSDSLRERVVTQPKESSSSQKLTVWATAYSSDPSQTDSTPFLTASGTLVREGVAAANFLPMGTKFKIPEMFGGKVFIIEDRMNPRYSNQQIVDIWFENTADAQKFGRKAVTIELL
ncbi:MAG: hypothetical protein UV58_C0002G0053 [Candidatus Wolfebacteria bacterium GW2011_GWC1_43_10]|uniref:3D domain-containing protein n=1 Tax=Candidatus Wolfebacteria bacterium GW2011_GWC1_43_10 TaxID=1619011 RepID=A0A0G1F877_9BACT|nr:MAG: hypothetical protein UV58_C0002G0053 [Candidatus Wolfebacteria bacterium GW2011_GWC1_43_10]